MEEDDAYQQFVARMNKGRKVKSGEEDEDSSHQSVSLTEGGGNGNNIPGGDIDPIAILQEKGLLNGRDHKSLKFREPSDIQEREQRVSKKKKKTVDHKLGPMNVVTRRENQNEYTLQACNKRKGEFPPLQEEISERVLANTEYKVDTFPIEDMLLRGFMPFYSYNISEIICAASNELHREAIIINNKNASLLAAATANANNTKSDASNVDAKATASGNHTANNNNNNNNTPQQQHQHLAVPKKRKTKHGDTTTGTNGEQEMGQYDDGKPYNEAMTVKPASQFSWDIPNYGSNSASGKAELYEKVRLYYKDCMDRMNQFFIDDQLDLTVVNSGTTQPQHRPPRSFAIYNEMEQQFKTRYEERLSILKDSASRVPKFDDEPPISKQWIDSYRLRPLTTDELCSRGTSCCFNVHVKKDNMRYIGRVFETPREVKEKNMSHNLGNHNTEPYIRNKQRFCIDCLLESWTDGTYEVVSGESLSLVQRNFFTVLCEPGQYKEDCMIPTMMNGKPTGITGYVPAYNRNKRISVPIKIQQIEGNHFYHISTNYLAETGMDFQ